MIQIEIDLLRRLYNGEIITLSDLDEDSRAILRNLLRQKLIRQNWDTGNWEVTSDGRRAVLVENERLEKQRQQRADEQKAKDAELAYLDKQNKKKSRHDWLIIISSPIISFLLGLFFEHFFDIVGYASRLWRVLFH